VLCQRLLSVGHGPRAEAVLLVHCAVVANFYAPWCPWCQRLEPTWEAVTAEVHKRYPEHDGRIRFGKVSTHFSIPWPFLSLSQALVCLAN
jgi:thiol-disulfide isomerase/thioredoxin